jgi:hypothetical protein
MADVEGELDVLPAESADLELHAGSVCCSFPGLDRLVVLPCTIPVEAPVKPVANGGVSCRRPARLCLLPVLGAGVGHIGVVERPLGDNSGERVGRLGRRADRHHSHLADDQAGDQHQTKRRIIEGKAAISLFHGSTRTRFSIRVQSVTRGFFKGTYCVALNLPLTYGDASAPCTTQYALWNTRLREIRNKQHVFLIPYCVFHVFRIMQMHHALPKRPSADAAHHHHPLAQDGAEAKRFVGLGGSAQVAAAAELHVQRRRQRGQRVEHCLQRL